MDISSAYRAMWHALAESCVKNIARYPRMEMKVLMLQCSTDLQRRKAIKYCAPKTQKLFSDIKHKMEDHHFAISTKKIKKKCKFFNHGYCKYGNKCRFTHPKMFAVLYHVKKSVSRKTSKALQIQRPLQKANFARLSAQVSKH